MMFLSRLSKGPPPQYRWLSWKFVGLRLLKKVPGDYYKYLVDGRSEENFKSKHDIYKDKDRTFPDLPFFDLNSQGEYGQAMLENILQAYSSKEAEIGYCQSMNFMAAFPLMISDANEKETFWFFSAILEPSKEQILFDGMKSFYEKDFPLLIQYMRVFNDLFKMWIPDLH